MRAFVAVWFALTVFAGPASALDALGQRFVRAFKEVCISQVTTGIVTASAGYEELSRDQRMVLARSFGSSEPADIVWTDPFADWIRLQQDMEVPEQCMFVSFRAQPRVVADEWNVAFSDVFRTEDGATLRVTRNGVRGGGFSSKAVSDGFVQVSFSTFTMNETNVAILTAIKVPQSRASCELWPEESEKCLNN